MQKAFKKIEEALNRLHDMQENHLESFDKDALPDLEKQSEERNIEMGRLMRSINDFVKRIEIRKEETSESMLLILNSRVTILLEQNKALEIKVKNLRENFKKEMKHISKGKKVIGSYRSAAAISNNPRIISVTN